MENIDIPEYEIEGLLQTLNELGIKGIMEWSDVLVLNHLQERGFIPSERDKVINVLKEQTDMSYGQIVELLQRYDKWKVVLPSYSLGLNLKLSSNTFLWVSFTSPSLPIMLICISFVCSSTICCSIDCLGNECFK